MSGMGPGIERKVGSTSKSLTLYHAVCCPSGCFLRKPDIEEVAERWAARVTDRTSKLWLADFIGELGGEIRRMEDCSLLLVAERIDCFVINGQDIWSMAEALGHLILHMAHVEAPERHPDGEPVILAVPASPAPGGPLARARLEAVWFAASFLMPDQMFRIAWDRYAGDLRKVAAEFRMPMGLIASRAVKLGLG